MSLGPPSSTLESGAENRRRTNQEADVNGYIQDPNVALRMARMMSEERIRNARASRIAREIKRTNQSRTQEAIPSQPSRRRVSWVMSLLARRA
jgi:hypothetical protein